MFHKKGHKMKKALISMFIFAVFLCNISTAIAEPKIESNNYITITREAKNLHSKLSEIYLGYEYKVKNIYNDPITIENIDIWNNANAQIAYLSVKKQNKEAAKQTLQRGLDYALPTLSTSIILSVFATPFTIVGNNCSNKNAQKEAQHYQTNPIKNYTLKPNQEITIRTMAIKKYAPLFRVIFKNPLTDEDMVLEMN